MDNAINHLWVVGLPDQENEGGSFSGRDEPSGEVADLVEAIASHYPVAGTGRPKTEIELLLRLHCLQLWYNLSDPGLEDAVHDQLSFQRFLGLYPLQQRVPDETTVLHFRRLLEGNGLAERIFVQGQRRPRGERPSDEGGHHRGRDDSGGTEQHQEPGRQARPGDEFDAEERGLALWDEDAGVDAKSGLVHTVKTTTASVHDRQMFADQTHGEETVIAGDSAYASQMLKTGCRQAGLVYLIHHKGTRAKPLSSRQRHRNRQKSSLRSKV